MENQKRKGRIAGLWIGVWAAVWVLGGCSNGDVEETRANGSLVTEKADAVAMKELALAVYPEEPVFESTEDQWDYSRAKRQAITETFAEAYHEFTVNTSTELLKERAGNQIYCPLSLYYALSLAADGAEGETQKEMLDVLGFEDPAVLAEECKNSFEALYHVPNEENNKPNEWGEYSQESRYRLAIANSLWADETVEVRPEFAVHGAEYFYADLFRADLQSEETAKQRVTWVRERTNGLITPSEKPMDDVTLLSIMNTVYFYDEWINRFDKEKTKEDEFTCGDGTEVTCDFMNMEMGSHGFRRGENYTESSLSLKNGVMTFYLPDEGVDVKELVKDAETLEAVLNGAGEYLSGQVVWKVPKFSYGSNMELSEMLRAVGMEQAFTENADFSGISDMPLFISKVIQDARLGIDEDGVEGASYTEILYCGAAMPTGRAEMILDRPFLYVVKNNGMILFMGICQNPAAE